MMDVGTVMDVISAYGVYLRLHFAYFSVFKNNVSKNYQNSVLNFGAKHAGKVLSCNKLN